ncbi:1-(5-phosphoribosyl)-5-[(5- phosphoribosylamino)methylideneamino] imidazole-4-carboxamide isomerase [Thermus sp. CCB_US3_UF1]|uniref:1-(5-phosphoribosyl)-5-[(5- phosphoribosylamino)methylideneamino] imidazole-4-carboxamide isomerase n=1 Tax=Thermus sp. CCB_US3_UF1 TaxID=1111069 RepID=UPI0002389CAA|nr:1-(5-phosphoribosyl)-5-[(5-phosphoribosylamino)methylideneamino] imidazole-4-carboxamide isomerase [Thermus sp. CCB_US3_UF1]AEV16021.1 1-(5-phosphoribosyl)-5-[(5- phosphoribosylamino)methylideneamino] imidazole-4-carboxamide isomerase [Thermus sp. CCB_US3_UF1]
MWVIPAVDLKGGRAVRLREGRPEAETQYGDPVEAALRWQAEGARLLHLVDLDRALGLGDNREALLRVAEALQIPFQVGGGVRSLAALREVLSFGAVRAVVGTVAVKDRALLAAMLGEVGPERLAVALDARGLEVVVSGWQEATPLSALDLLREWAEMGVRTVIYTDVRRDGTLEGLDLEAVARVRGAWPHELIAGGGIAGPEDLRGLARLGVEGALVGKALYEGRVRLRDFLQGVS